MQKPKTEIIGVMALELKNWRGVKQNAQRGV